MWSTRLIIDILWLSSPLPLLVVAVVKWLLLLRESYLSIIYCHRWPVTTTSSADTDYYHCRDRLRSSSSLNPVPIGVLSESSSNVEGNLKRRRVPLKVQKKWSFHFLDVPHSHLPSCVGFTRKAMTFDEWPRARVRLVDLALSLHFSPCFLGRMYCECAGSHLTFVCQSPPPPLQQQQQQQQRLIVQCYWLLSYDCHKQCTDKHNSRWSREDTRTHARVWSLVCKSIRYVTSTQCQEDQKAIVEDEEEKTNSHNRNNNNNNNNNT